MLKHIIFIRVAVVAMVVTMVVFWTPLSLASETDEPYLIQVFDNTQFIEVLPYALSYAETVTSDTVNSGIDGVVYESAWTASQGNTINSGITSSALWLTTTIDSKNLTTSQRFYLKLSNPELDSIKVFRGKKIIANLGQSQHFQNRIFKVPDFVIPIELYPGTVETFHIRLKSEGSVRTNLSLHSDQHLLAMENKQSLVVGAYYGLASVLCVYFFAFYLFSEERIYLWVSVSIAALVLLQLNIDGFLYQYLYPNHPDWFFSFLLIPTILAYISTFLIALDFFYLKENSRPLYSLLKLHVYIGVVLVFCWTVLSSSTVLYLTIPYIFSGGIACIIVCVASLKQDNSSTIYFISAMIMASIGSVIYVSLYIGLLPSTLLLETIFKTSSVLEMALVSISLFKRYQESKAKLTEERNSILHSLVKANKVKDEFLSVISHELRTPMNGVEGALELVKDYKLPDHISKYIDMARFSSEDMVTMINNILDYTELNESVVSNQEPFNLVEEVTKLVNCMKGRFLKDTIVISVAVEPSVAGIYQGDPTLLFKVIRHILSNAMKFTDSGKIQISISSQNDRLEPNVDLVTIRIKDTGEGIEQSNLEEIFEGFRQQDASMVRKFQGLGLGLPISKAFTKTLNGHIDIASEVGIGTEVTIAIPLEVTRRERDCPASQQDLSTGLLMLVVEDNTVNSKILVAILEKLGHTPVTAENGAVAVELAKKNRYDFIWMDCQMPVMDGLEATRHIRAMASYVDTPIVAVTANAFAQDEKNCISAGMSDFLVKPVNRIAIERVVRKWTT